MKKLTFEYNFPAEQQQRVRALAAECGLHELTASILYSRGIDDAEKVNKFLHPSREHFLSPFLMRGMRELKEEIDAVRAGDGLVAVYGDYRCGRDRRGIHSAVRPAPLRGALRLAHPRTRGGVRNVRRRAGKTHRRERARPHCHRRLRHFQPRRGGIHQIARGARGRHRPPRTARRPARLRGRQSQAGRRLPVRQPVRGGRGVQDRLRAAGDPRLRISGPCRRFHGGGQRSAGGGKPRHRV